MTAARIEFSFMRHTRSHFHFHTHTNRPGIPSTPCPTITNTTISGALTRFMSDGGGWNAVYVFVCLIVYLYGAVWVWGCFCGQG